MKKESCHFCEIKSKAAGALSDNELDFLDRNCAEVDLNRGEAIIRQGQLSSHIGYIKSGLAKIHMKGPTGRDQVLKIVTPGTYIGIQTILYDKVHRYSATVLEPAKVCYIDTHSFRQLLGRNPQFAGEIIAFLCQDELSYFERFVNLAQKQVNGRLADALLFFAKEVYRKDAFELSLTRADLAALIGVTRESASRALQELARLEVIRLELRTIEIIDKERLERIGRSG